MATCSHPGCAELINPEESVRCEECKQHFCDEHIKEIAYVSLCAACKAKDAARLDGFMSQLRRVVSEIEHDMQRGVLCDDAKQYAKDQITDLWMEAA